MVSDRLYFSSHRRIGAGFYSVVGGWCTHYFIESIMGRGITDDPTAMRSAFEAFAADPVQSVMGHVIFLTTTAGVVLCGVERGIERVGKILMPLLFILMLILIVRGLMLPGAIEGVKFLFMPDPEALRVKRSSMPWALPSSRFRWDPDR